MPADEAELPDLRLKFPAGRFEQPVLRLIVAAQLSVGITSLLVLLYWFHILAGELRASVSTFDQSIEIFGLAVMMVTFVLFLHQLYE
ncbi:hypothetical protein [Halorarum salinum]|uniref:Uncharacterized protein n=1 Tax=Halorarum salinum TaxID=2743089 RepID=A0A7D5L9U4_9EURY|nr:hypothetical protein [Halobaculum salinum]QLG61347.1 hypothetical protein HUG12_06200 [Halobaculum salinum]